MHAWEQLDAFVDRQGIRRTPAPPPDYLEGYTTGWPRGGHGHTKGSFHYPQEWGGPKGSTGQGRDYGIYNSDAPAIARALLPYAQGPNYLVAELFFSPLGIFYKYGVAFVPSEALRAGHYNHCHAAKAIGRAALPGSLPPPAPKPSPTAQEDDDMAGVFLTDVVTDTWWLFDGVHRRPVGKGENQTLVDLGLVKPGPDGKPFVKRVPQEYLKAIPVAAGY